MKQVYKYDLAIEGGPSDIMMPRGAAILHVGHQGDPEVVHIWAMVDVSEPTTILKTFYVVGTGQDIPEPSRWQHIGTVVFAVDLVWHVFQETIR